MVSWGGPPWFQEEEWDVLFVCCLALVAVLLASESLPCVPGHSPSCLPFLLHSPILHGHCTGSVCACMCAPVHTCIERYICGVREGSRAQLRACSQDTAHWNLSLPFCVAEIRGCGWVPLLSSLQVALLDVRIDGLLQPSVCLIFSFPPL